MALDHYDLITQAARAASQKGHDDYYASNMVYLGRQFDLEQIRNVAEIGAKDMEQLGPEGQQWAQHLRSNPYAAVKMAELQGGFGAIMQRLRYGQAAGSDAMAQTVLENEGATGLSLYGAGQANLALSNERGAVTDLLTGALGAPGATGDAGDGTSQGGGPGGGGLANMDMDTLARLAIARPELARALLPINKENRERTGGFDSQIAAQLNTKFLEGAKNFIVQRDYYETAVAAAEEAAQNPASAGSVDFALVQAYGKMLDPNSVVRNEEGRFIVESQSSVVQDKVNEFLRLFSATGTLNPTARYNLMKQIEAKYRQVERRHVKYLDEINTKLDRMDAPAFFREQATPIGLDPSEVKLNLEPWAAAAGSERTPGTPGGLKGLLFKPDMPKGSLMHGEMYVKPNGEPLGVWNKHTGHFE